MLLRGEFVFVDQAAEQVAATDAIECDHVGARSLVARRRLVEGWSLRECAVRPVLVVMRDVGREHVLKVAAAEDQEPVEALAANAADQALGMRSRLWRPYRRIYDPTWLRDVAKVFPVQHLASGLHQAFDPTTTGSGIVWSDVGVLALWG